MAGRREELGVVLLGDGIDGAIKRVEFDVMHRPLVVVPGIAAHGEMPRGNVHERHFCILCVVRARTGALVESGVLIIAFFVAAVLYASVGHAGGSGYLAVMAFAGTPAPVMRPTALVLNLLVASIAVMRFSRAGFFSWRLFWPFALGSVPLAFVGGAITLPGHWYRTLVGLVLWAAAIRLWLDLQRKTPHHPPIPAAVLCGGGIGFLAGITGTGGGIFLSPLLLFMGWADTRETGGVSAAFILVTSMAGLAANPSSIGHLPAEMPLWSAAAVAGGLIGAELGSRRIGTTTFRRLLGVVLVIAGAKLIFS